MHTQGRRPRLLFVVDALDHGYQSKVTQGVVRAARRYKADMMVLVGGPTVLANRHLEQREFVYGLASPEDFDGLILLGTSLTNPPGRKSLSPLLDRFSSLPIVSIGIELGRGGTVLVDNVEGIRRIIKHLMDAHRYTRFAYISGPENNGEAQIRLGAFKETLKDWNLTLPDELIVVGAFTESSGERAVAELIDERGVDIRALDAIVAANDSMAVGAMEELHRRGIHVPTDVAIVGFDDIEAARYADVPLTTVQQPLILQGERAVQRLLATRKETADDAITVSPELVIRRSCGCGRAKEAPTLITNNPVSPTETLPMIIRRKRTMIQNDLAAVAEMGGIVRGWEELLLDAVIDAASGRGYESVTLSIQKLVRASIRTGEALNTWATVIASLDRHLRHCTNPGTAEAGQVEAILHRARVAMSEATDHFHAAKVRELRNQTISFNQAAISMLTAVDVQDLADTAARHLPKLGIGTCSISLFEDLNPAQAYLKRFLVLDNGKKLDLQGSFLSRLLAAPEIVADRPHALVVEPLCYYGEKYGLAALEYGPRDGNIYEQLGAFFSAAIKGLHTSSKEAGVTFPPKT